MDDIVHSGIKGMKWGRRLYQNKDGSLTPLGRIRYRKGSDNAPSSRRVPEGKKIRKRHLSELSDEELRAKVNRLQLENSYIDAYKRRYPTRKKDHKVMKFLTQIAGEQVKKYVNARVSAALNEKFGASQDNQKKQKGN